jgi:methionyl-tRNA formyltransferase
VVVSGTNLVGRAVIEAANSARGIVNLHTGISPYVKGGPNCTNWCLAENKLHWIGNTIMWLDLGIDTGAIIATEQAPLDGTESLEALHFGVVEHAHGLYTRAVASIAAGLRVPRIPQDSIATGRTYYNYQWSGAAMLRAYYNFRRHYRPEAFSSSEFRDESRRLRLISLEQPADPPAVNA